MEVIWNKTNLPRPPTTTWRCAANSFDAKGFVKSIDSIIRSLESQTLLRTEGAMLSRSIYRMKTKLRNDRGLKNMEKVNRALLNYLALKLEEDYKALRDSCVCEDNVCTLPSQQMLEYCLVRTQALAVLMLRIEKVATLAGTLLATRMKLGQAWNMSLVAYATVSRIWFLSRYLTRKCCIWYKRMYSYRDKLRKIGVPWLSESDELPEDLKIWLKVSWIDERADRSREMSGLSEGIFNLIKHENHDFDKEFLDEEKARETNKSLIASPIERSVENSPATKNTEIAAKNNLSFCPNDRLLVGKRVKRDAFMADLARTRECEESPIRGKKASKMDKDKTKRKKTK